MGHFIGKGKFVFSSAEKADFKRENEEYWDSRRKLYHDKYISVTRLKKELKYTDKLIIDFLPKSKKLYTNKFDIDVKGWKISKIIEIEKNNKDLSMKLKKRRGEIK